ncbi:MAG: acyl-CoA dehydrogenase family protein, partial [Chloroflexota bacterium]
MTTVAHAAEAQFDLTLTEEQELVQRTAREFARDRVLPIAAEIDEKSEVPRELVREMAELGFMGIDIPERWGGAGLDMVAYVLV